MHPEKKLFLSLWAAGIGAKILVVCLAIAAGAAPTSGIVWRGGGDEGIRTLGSLVGIGAQFLWAYANGRWMRTLNPAKWWPAIVVGVISVFSCINLVVAVALAFQKSPPFVPEPDPNPNVF